MAVTREQRQQIVRQIVREGAIRTQNELVAALGEHGCEVTQATVSRDIAELDLRKGARGLYTLPEDQRLWDLGSVAIKGTRRAGNQVIVHTEPGSASSVAAAIDAAQREEVLGTIAGDDTILVIACDDAAGESFQAYVDETIR